MSQKQTCRICGSTEWTHIASAVAGAPEAAVYRCDGCGIVYLYPIMSEEEEAAFYREAFDRYMQDRSGPGWKSPAHHFSSHQAEGERRLEHLRSRLCPDHDVLEVGSSTGYFLDDLRGYVRSVTGVEPHTLYAEFANARGIETVPSVDDLNGRRFDHILLFYVLEHLRDPVGYLAALMPLLKKKGRVIVEVPNVDDALVSMYDIPAFGPFYWQRAHYHYFSYQTLADVLRRAGYTGEVFPVQRYDLSNHMVWMMHGKPGGTGTYRHIFGPVLEAAYAEALKRHWLCDTVFAVAQPQS